VFESVEKGAVGTTYVVPEYRATLDTRRSARLPVMSEGPPTWTLAVGVNGIIVPGSVVIEIQSTELEREVTVIQFIPFSEYAAVADGLDATATKRPITELYVTEFHLDVLGIVIEVQLAPPSEYAPELELKATATNLFVVGLHATEDHVKELGSPGDAAVHDVPLSE
jgi:hypothetical protein